MGFLKDLGTFGSALLSAVNDQFTPGEMTPRSLDTVDPNDPDKVIAFGELGEFAKRIDAAALRSYVETGSIRNIRPRTLDILMQEPDMTIVVKKRLFSSLIDNYKFDLMDSADKLFIRASKKLFQNKCQAISAYEKLTKIEKIVKNKGVLDEFMVPHIMSGVDTLDAFGVGSIIDSKTRSVLETLRKVSTLSEPAQTTTWAVENDSPFFSENGEGTGVFELTTAVNVSTVVSTQFGGGRADLTFEDPYRMMIITEEDIEKAITDASNFFKNNNFFRVSERELERITEDLKQQFNNMRMQRGAPGIRILINDDTVLYRRVRAIIDETGQEIFFNYDPGILGIGATIDVDSGNLTEPTALTSSELSLFSTIVKNIYTLLNLRRNTESQIENFNKDDNIRYVYEKMMLHYAGKTIIQPMDTIHVFISSKTQIDSKAIGFTKSNFEANTILGSINKQVDNIKNALSDIKGFFGSAESNRNTSVENEKIAIAGPDFPTWLWVMLRNEFTKQSAGVQVFSGVVDGARSSYNDGRYTTSISAKDNTYYFSLGQINFKPSVDVFNGALYDPLTPFKLDFDASSGFIRGEVPDLLEENIKLASSGALKFKSGRFRGAPFSEETYKVKDGERLTASTPLNFRMILNDPDGLVYRWKSGIGSLTKFGQPHPISSIQSDTSPALTKDPFAGQDVMNVISLLITGQPYNYNNFVLAAIKSGNLSRDDLLNEDGSISYYRGLLADLTKNNITWGNFIPFKQQIINERGMAFLIKGQYEVSVLNDRINQLLEERSRLFDALVMTADGNVYASNPQIFSIDANFNFTHQIPPELRDASLTSPDTLKAAANLADIDRQIAQAQSELQTKISNSDLGDGTLRMFGDDISFDPNVSGMGSEITEEQISEARREFRQKLNYLTQRRLWKVKANEDVNLFIVDDQYDKNLDIQAFEKAITGGLKLFQSDYSSVAEQIPRVAAELGLEVFADTQGHIRVRPPGYNKVPSSVFFRMMKDTHTKGKRVFPKILESLFINQIEGLVDKIEIIEDEIRLRTASLGFETDKDSAKFLSGSASGLANYTFKFVTNEQSGSLGSLDIRNIIQQSNPDLKEDSEYRPLKPLSEAIAGQVKQTALFDITKKAYSINKPAFFQNISTLDHKIAQIRNRLERLKGVKAPDRFFTIDPRKRSQAEVLNVINDISRFISERQSLLKILSNAIRNLEQGLSIDNDPKTSRALLFPNLTNGSVPELLEHMIEDENNDDFGQGSGARYVIRDNQIISLEIAEQPPPFTLIEVNGLFGEGFVDPPASLALTGSSGGNAISSAFAVDYDMWRMYGFKAGQPVFHRALSDPDAQLAPLAVFLLNLARKNIFNATITITGNEYMQPGEVVYIEDRNLLFYVENVSHSFNYSGQFTTTLKLTYGHTPGQYIPTMLDVVGKALYSKRHQSNLTRHVRHGHPAGEIPITTLAIDNRSEIFESDALVKLVSGTFGTQNRKNLANIIVAASGAFTPDLRKQPIIELRVYHNSEAGFAPNDVLKSTAEAVKQWLIAPSKKAESVITLGGVQSQETMVPDNSLPEGFTLDPDQVRVKFIDRTDPQSPSSGAWNIVRNLIDNQIAPSTVFDGISVLREDTVLFNNIIDVWLTFDDISNTVETSKVSTGNSQSEAENRAKTAELISKRVGKNVDNGE